MGKAGNALLRGVDAESVVADLDRLRAAHVVAEHWLLAVENQLDGAITGDPGKLLELSGFGSFEMPADTSDPAAITGYALDRVRWLIGAYAEALDRTHDADELTHRLLLKLVGRQVATEAELEA